MALALKNKMVPASLHYKTANPGLDIENPPFSVVDRLTTWPRLEAPRRAGLSSFGIGGTNSHAILEEAPDAPAVEATTDRPFEILPVSGKTATQRDALIAGVSKLETNLRD